MGAKTTYKPEYCDRLIEYMREGLSFESFGAELNVGRRTLYDWVEKYEEFADAKDIATMISLQHWEKKGYESLHEPKNFNSVVYIFSMKCRFGRLGWKDTPEQEPQTKDAPDKVEAAKQLEALKAMLRDEACQQTKQSTPALSPPASQQGLLGASFKPE